MNSRLEPPVPPEDPSLRVFVALPGTDLGPDATWKDPKDVRAFYDKVAKALKKRLRRPVELIVEREKTTAGVIHESMFREALVADVYLADLTGRNPNVFLELGVRYALRRHVTVPLSQSTDRLPFNVEHMRAVQYANRPDDDAIAKVVDLVESGLAKQTNDSPVLAVLDLVAVDRTLWEKVSGGRANSLLHAAERATATLERLTLLREALESSPRSVDVRLRFATELRKAASYTEALQVLDEGIRLDPTRASFFHERGLNLGRLGEDLQAAADALREAVRLEPANKDYLASLGGALRRLALKGAPEHIDEALLRQAAESYQAASGVDRHDTYPALNLVRILLLMSRFDKEARTRTTERLQQLEHLCAFEVGENRKDYWRAFDLADVQLLLAKRSAGCETYRNAIELVPRAQRKSILSSPMTSLVELLNMDVVGSRATQGISEAIQVLREAMANE